MDVRALGVTLRLALSVTSILFVIGVPLAYWLATTRWRGRFLVEALVSLPLVLPPTVLGFYLLTALGPRGSIGGMYHRLTGSYLPFTFTGILVGSLIFNLPFTVRPFLSAFASVDRRLIEASWCLGHSRWSTFWRIVIPLSWPGLLTGIVLCFVHVVGEFGVVLMVGGNIPGVTRTLSIAIYDDVQTLNYASAGRAALLLLTSSFAALAIVYGLQRRVLPL